ncbi:hypothetical protein IIA16_05065, partial [bacterium]|nr:hypothetical protein [bacterium]
MHHRPWWPLLLLSLSVACWRQDGAQRDIPPGPWALETVDRLGDLGHGLSMAIDADGMLHLTY